MCFAVRANPCDERKLFCKFLAPRFALWVDSDRLQLLYFVFILSHMCRRSNTCIFLSWKGTPRCKCHCFDWLIDVRWTVGEMRMQTEKTGCRWRSTTHQRHQYATFSWRDWNQTNDTSWQCALRMILAGPTTAASLSSAPRQVLTSTIYAVCCQLGLQRITVCICRLFQFRCIDKLLCFCTAFL